MEEIPSLEVTQTLDYLNGGGGVKWILKNQFWVSYRDFTIQNNNVINGASALKWHDSIRARQNDNGRIELADPTPNPRIQISLREDYFEYPHPWSWLL